MSLPVLRESVSGVASELQLPNNPVQDVLKQTGTETRLGDTHETKSEQCKEKKMWRIQHYTRRSSQAEIIVPESPPSMTVVVRKSMPRPNPSRSGSNRWHWQLRLSGSTRQMPISPKCHQVERSSFSERRQLVNRKTRTAATYKVLPFSCVSDLMP